MTTKLEISNRQLEIIEAAGHIMTREGIGGLTTKNLAKAMKFSESAIYRHFNNKESIVISMLDFLANEMDGRLSKVIEDHIETQSKFEAIFESQIKFCSNNPHFLVAVFSDGLMDESTHLNEKVLRIINLKMGYLIPVLKQGQQEGVFTKTIDSEELAYIVLGTFRLLMFRWRADKFKFDLIKEGNLMIKSLLALLSK